VETASLISHKAGQAALTVRAVHNQSTVTASFATSPMKLLAPRSRGRSVSVYTSNFGGGLVAGDQTRLDVQIGQDARCFIGTQASTKIYRNPRSLPCGHVTNASVESNGLLVFAPAPVQPFADSNYHQQQQFRLAGSAGLVLVDWFTSGRSARGERWSFTRFSSRNEVWVNKTEPGEVTQGEPERPLQDLVFLDAVSLDATSDELTAPHRTGRFNCFAMLLLLGPPLEQTAQRLLHQIGEVQLGHRLPLVMSASPVREGAVIRVAGEQVHEVERCLHGYLAQLAECLGEHPWSRRW
jgi:urease accessory protein